MRKGEARRPPPPRFGMLLRNQLHCAVRALSPLPAAFSLHRLLLYSTAAPFVVKDYLVNTCGLTPAQAARSSKYLSHLNSPYKPDAALAFFADIGLAKADITAAIARDPSLLCIKVNETLNHRVGMLRDIGLSLPQISRLMTIVPRIFSKPLLISRLAFYLSFFGSYDEVHAALRNNVYLLNQDVEGVVKPNMEFLLQCGLTHSRVISLFSRGGCLLTMQPESVKEMVARAEKLGVPRNSGMFKGALETVCNSTPDTLSVNIEFLKRAFSCSEAELVVSKQPSILCLSVDNLGRTLEFLKVEVGLEPTYIAHRPVLLKYSLQRRLMPRHYVMKILKEKGLVEKDIDFYNVISITHKRFLEKFLDCHEESIPGLAGAYAAACAGQVPPEIKLRV